MTISMSAAILTPPLLHVDKTKLSLESRGSSGIGLRVCFFGIGLYGSGAGELQRVRVLLAQRLGKMGGESFEGNAFAISTASIWWSVGSF